MMEQIGKGQRLTTGKICGKPMTDEENAKLFEGLEKEKAVAAYGPAALARQKAKKPMPGDDGLLKAWEDQKIEEAKVKFARAREAKGESTAADEKLFNSRIVKKLEQAAEPGGGSTPKPAPKATKVTKKRKRKRSNGNGSESDGSEDSDEGDDGKDLLKQKWMDDELGECTVIRRTSYSYQGQRALWYTYYEDDELEKERSSVEEAREWIQQFGC
jgi:hypothetical protein